MSTSPSPIHSSPDSYGDIINEIDTVLDPRDSEPRRPTLSPSLLVASLETETPDNANATKNASQMDSVNSLHPQHASRGVIHAPDASTSSPLPKLTRSPREAIVAVALQPANNTNDQQKKTILVSIAQGELFADAARRAAWEHDEVPESLVEEITGQLARAVVSQGKRKREEDTRREGQEKETGTGSEIQRQIQVQDLVDAYARNYSEFNVVLRQSSPFPKAYHALVNSPVPHIFDTLLFIERELARPVQEIILARDTSLSDLVKRYKSDMESLSLRGDLPRQMAQMEADRLAGQHIEEMETVQATFASALADLTGNQKRRYVGLIERLYEEYLLLVGPVRGTENEREVVASLLAQDPECGRRMVLRAMEASGFGKSEGQLRDLGTSTDESFLPVTLSSGSVSSRDLISLSGRSGSTNVTVQMRSLEDLESELTDEESGTEGDFSRRSGDLSMSEHERDDAVSETTSRSASRSAVSRTPSPQPRPSSALSKSQSPSRPALGKAPTPPAPSPSPVPLPPGVASELPILKPENITHEDRMLNFLVGELISMGFDVEMSQAALEMTTGRLDQAINLLLENPEQVKTFMDTRPAVKPDHAIPPQPVPAPILAPTNRPPTAPLLSGPPQTGPPLEPKSRSVSSSSLAKWRESLQSQRSSTNLDPKDGSSRSRQPSVSSRPAPVEPALPKLPPVPPKAVQAAPIAVASAKFVAAQPIPTSAPVPSPSDSKLSKSADSDKDKESSSNNTLRRLGNLFGKVSTGSSSQQLGVNTAAPPKPKRKQKEEKEVVKPERYFIWEPDLAESFTVWQGTHARTMYNLRLAVLPSDNWFRSPREAEELALRAQTAQGLYGNSLSGVVVVVTKSEFTQWRVAARLAPRTRQILGTGILRTIFDAAQRTTEFHFDPLHEQFRAIEADLDAADGANPMDSVSEGDVFISRHGNLPLVHVVFYLIMDEEHHPSAMNAQGQANAELTPRTPLVSGYRNLLRAANACDVNNLIIPLFLLPEPYLSETQDWNLLMRRCDQVCRSTKSFMTEAARNAQGGSGSGGYASGGIAGDRDAKTWQFIIPPLQGNNKDRRPKESWDLRFPYFRDRFADVFRA